MYAALGALVALVLVGVGLRRGAQAAVADVRAAQRQIDRLQGRISALEEGPDRARLQARLADVERVHAAFLQRGRPRLAGWRRPFTLGLTLEE